MWECNYLGCMRHAPHEKARGGCLHAHPPCLPLDLQLDDSGGLGDQLLAGFANRFHGLLDASLNVTSKVDSTAIKEKLTLREKQLFDAGRDASAQYNTWKAAKTRGRIEQASIVGHQPRKGKGKKRSRDASASSS